MESFSHHSINFSPLNSSYVSVDFLFDVMATFFDFPSYGSNLATNSTFYNGSYTSTLCVVYNITVPYYTSSTPSRISS